MKAADLAAILQACLPDLAPLGPGKWSFALALGLKRRARAEIGPRWLTLRCAMPHRADEPSLATILRQSALSGGVKLVKRRSRMVMRAEVPLLLATAADADWISRQTSAAVHGLRAATPGALPAPAPHADSSADADPELLADCCRAAGWQAVVKPDGEVQVDIQSRFVRRVVSIVQRAGTLRAFVTLADGEIARASGVCVEAAAHFLLRASSALCFARAWTAGSAAAPAAAGFECAIAFGAGDAPLATAVDALATACELFGNEVEALLESAAVARHYLQCVQCARPSAAPPAMRGAASPAAPSPAFASLPFAASEASAV